MMTAEHELLFMTDDELNELIWAIEAEQHRRARNEVKGVPLSNSVVTISDIDAVTPAAAREEGTQ